MQPGDIIEGRYALLSELGHGGMGTVYVAVDQRLNRRVAVKVLRADPEDPEGFRRRFDEEARILTGLESPHVITVFDHGEHDGTPYLVTPLIGGGNLSELIGARGALEPAWALELMTQVSEALSDAHAHGIVHRDVKPANILLRDPAAGHPHGYLCDFGIAKDEQTSEQTTMGAVIGTWAYLAPERLNGDPATVASDLYAVGCVLWAALTGRNPYGGTAAQLAMAHTSAPIPQLTPDSRLARDLNGFFRIALAKDPAQRFESASACAQALRSLSTLAAAVGSARELDDGDGAVTERQRSRPQSAAATSGAPPNTPFLPTDVPRPGRRRAVVAGAVGLLAVALVAAIGTAVLWPEPGGNDPRRSAADAGLGTASPSATPSDAGMSDTSSASGPSTGTTTDAATAPSTSTPSTTASVTQVAGATCFDGTTPSTPGACLDLMRDPQRPWLAMRSAFPGLDTRTCRQQSNPPDRKLEAWLCIGEGRSDVTVSRYPSIEVAEEHYDTKYPNDGADVEGDHYVWRYTTLNSGGDYVLSGMYKALPYSVTVSARKRQAVTDTFDALGWRSEDELGTAP